MSEMITIKGMEVSEDTIALALMQYFTEHPKKYIFQAGDVASYEDEGQDSDYRIIVKYKGELLSFLINGEYSSSYCQRQFESNKYRKIGVLSDYIK